MRFLSELPDRLRRITTSGSYKPEIDGLRFWAILPVVLWHGIQRISRTQADLSHDEQRLMTWIPEARIGVMLFFVISGFIIASQFIRGRELGRPLDLRAYFYRRITRIEPPYLLLLLATYLLLTLTPYRPENVVAFGRGDQTLTESFFASIFYLHGVMFNEMPKLLAGGWSLEIEVQFYILAPAIFALFYFAGTVRRRLIVGTLVLIAALVVSRVFDEVFGFSGPHRYTLIRYFLYFWLGALVAEIHHARAWPKMPVSAWDVAAFVSLGAYLWSGIAEHGNRWALPVAALETLRVGAFFLMFGGAMNGRAFARLCCVPWICLLGGACYSIYLTHVQVMQVATPIVARVLDSSSLVGAAAIGYLVVLPLVLAFGLVFYAAVERPFMIPHWPTKLVGLVRTRFGNAVPDIRTS